MEFFNKHFNPSSTQRARLAIYLHAQGKAEGAQKRQEDAQKKAHEAAEEEKVKLKQEYSKYFLGQELDAGTKIRRLLEGLGSQDPSPSIWQTVESLGDHLREALKLPEKTITVLLEQAKILGVKQTNPDEPRALNGTTAVDYAIEITDVRLFKSKLTASSGARPVKDLVEYEDTDAKL